MKNIITIVAALMISGQANSQNLQIQKGQKMESKEHYTFKLSDKVIRHAVRFKNRYGLSIAADLYLPKNKGSEPLAALTISSPFGAVKEQSSGLYAQARRIQACYSSTLFLILKRASYNGCSR